jgi:plastocyanin
MTQTHQIDINNMKFNPASVTVAKGDTVQWNNKMTMDHTVTPDKNEFPSSGDIGPGKSFSHTFGASGTVAYHCEIHPRMKGTVIVS